MTRLIFLALTSAILFGCAASKVDTVKAVKTIEAKTIEAKTNEAKTIEAKTSQVKADLAASPEAVVKSTDEAVMPSNKILLGYLSDGLQPTAAQFKKMTHVAFSFLRAADTTGAVVMTAGWDNLDQVISEAHQNGVKALISFGGGEFVISKSLMGNPTNRTNLIKNIIAFMKAHNFDGFDSDWEPSWIDDKAEMEAVNNVINDHYLDFIKDMRSAIDAEFGKGNKSFSAAVMNANSIWYSEEKQIVHFPQNNWWDYLDWVALMNYDNDVGVKHATYESVFGPEGSVAYWTGFGIPKSKIVVGVPFYARANWGPEWLFYKDVIAKNPELSTAINNIKHDAAAGAGEKDYGFNGVDIVKTKTQAAKDQDLQGIMFWQLSGDLPVENPKSLLKAMYETMVAP